MVSDTVVAVTVVLLLSVVTLSTVTGNGDNVESSDYGIRVKISHKGITYLKSITNVFIQQLNSRPMFVSTSDVRIDGVSTVSIRGKFVRHQGQLQGDQQEQQQQVQQSSRQRDWLQLKRPDLITWFEDSASTNFTGRLSGRSRGVKFNDQYAMILNNTRTTISVQLSEANGRLALATVGCLVRSDDIRARFYDTRKQIQRVLDRIEAELYEIMQKRLQYSRCNFLNAFVDTLSVKLQKSETKVPLFDITPAALLDDQQQNSTGILNSDNDTVSKSLIAKSMAKIVEVLKSLFIDFRMAKNPEISSDNLDLFFTGDISSIDPQSLSKDDPSNSNNNHVTDMIRNFLPDSTSIRMYDKMLYVSISDFVINSLLYHMNERLNLNVKINRKTMPIFARFLYFSCDGPKGQVCVGSFFPEMADQFYDHSLEIRLIKSDQSPSVVINPGKATIFLYLDVLLLAIQRGVPKLILKTKVGIESEFDIQISQGMNLTGKIYVKKFTMQLVDNNYVNISQDQLDNIAAVGQVLVQELIQNRLSKGIRIPPLRGVSLIEPRIRFLNRKLFLETDVEMTKFLISKLIMDFVMLKNNNSNVAKGQ